MLSILRHEILLNIIFCYLYTWQSGGITESWLANHFHAQSTALIFKEIRDLLLLHASTRARTQTPMYLHVRQSSESTEEGHGLSRTWWATQDERLVFCQPSIQQRFMANCIEGWYYNIRSCNFVRFNFNLRNLGLPWHPFTCNGHLEAKNHRQFRTVI